MKNNLNIALLMGGCSPERAVSKSSGKAIYEALLSLGYNVRLVDPAYGILQPEAEEAFFADSDAGEIGLQNYIETINSSLFNGVDLAFLALHGKWGEDGTIQSLLELRGIRYTGSGPLSSSLAMDKSMSKIMFQHFDVNTPNWFVALKNNLNIGLVKEKIKKFFGYPCIVKPNDQGSTIGLSICRGEVEVERVLSAAMEFSDKAVIEEYIPGREITAGIIDQHALPVLEILPKNNIFDYECKYTDGMSEYIVPAKIPDDVRNHIQHQALLAYNSVGCRHYGRVDFRMTEDFGSYCLEVNTLPGMTAHSLVPKMARSEGMEFNELIERIIRIALK